MRYLILIASFLLLVTAGCESDKVVEPGEIPVVEEFEVAFVSVPETVSQLIGEASEVEIEVVVHKESGGIGTGARVEFYEPTGFGSFVAAVDTAGDDGKASATLRLDAGKYGICKIFVLVPGGRADAEIQVRQITAPASIQIIGDGQIKVEPGQNGIIQFSLLALDSNHVEVPNVPISARLWGDGVGGTFGVVNADLRFNSLGLYGREWLIVTTNIPELETQLSDSVLITVERLNVDIGSVTVRAFPAFLNLQPDSIGYAEIRVQVRDAANNGIAGLIIDAITDMGTIVATDTTDSGGVARFPISFLDEYGVAHITIRIRGTDLEGRCSIVVDNDEEETKTVSWIYPNVPVDPYLIHPDSLVTFRVRAIVKDNQGQALEGEVFDLVTDMGVFEVVPAVTNQLGIAEIVWNNNFEEGTAHLVYRLRGTDIFAMDEIRVEFVDSSPRSIRLRSDRPNLPVGEEMTLTATVKDEGGQPVTIPTTVVFKMMNGGGPDGSHFPNGESLDSATTDASGEARIVLSAGRAVYGILLKVYTWRDPETRLDTLSTGIISTIQVVAGPPASIDIEIDNEGEDAGGGTWRIPVTARVYDSFMNPVANNIPVGFTVIPDDIGTIGHGYTGIDIGSGSTNGVAYSWLTYHSVKTFKPFTIQAEVQVEGGVITAQKQDVLPLQGGRLELTINPENVMLDREHPNDTFVVRVTAVLEDGHQITIDNAPILFRTDRARFYSRDENGVFHPNPVRVITTNGVATVYLRGDMSGVYLDEFTLEVTVHIEASVEGYDVVADPAFLFVTRH